MIENFISEHDLEKIGIGEEKLIEKGLISYKMDAYTKLIRYSRGFPIKVYIAMTMSYFKQPVPTMISVLEPNKRAFVDVEFFEYYCYGVKEINGGYALFMSKAKKTEPNSLLRVKEPIVDPLLVQFNPITLEKEKPQSED